MNEQFIGTHHFTDEVVNVESTVYAPGTYHHVTEVVDWDSATISLWIDGIQESAYTFNPSQVTYEFSQNPWRIGLAFPVTTEYGMHGHSMIDDARMYSRALNPSEVRSLADW